MKSTDAHKLLSLIREDAIVGLASELVKIPSVSTQETPVAEFLAQYFTQRDYDVEMQEVEPGRFQTIATLKGSGGGKTLMFNGHIDTNTLSLGWKRDPWMPVVEGDRLYGHGVENMKGGVSSMINAAEAIRQSEIKLKGDLVLACVVGETQGGEGTYHLLNSGIRADMAVLPEPFGIGNIATVHAGIVHMAIHTYGVSGHLRNIENTINAIHKMTRVVEAVQKVQFTYTPRPDLPALPRLNIGSIIGGRGKDYVLIEAPYVPDICTTIVDVHFVHGQTVDTIVADIRRVLDPLSKEDQDFKYEIEIPPPQFFKGRRRLVMYPIDVPKDEYIVKTVAKYHQMVTGKPPKAIGSILPMSYSAGDTCFLWNDAGIPCLFYGPGPVRDGVDSYIHISEMVTVAKTLALTALDVCNIPSEG